MCAFAAEGHLSLPRVPTKVLNVFCRFVRSAVCWTAVVVLVHASIAAMSIVSELCSFAFAVRKAARAKPIERAIVTLFDGRDLGLAPDEFFATTVKEYLEP